MARFGVDSKEFDLLKKELRSIALSVGPLVFVSVEQLDRDYTDLNGHPIRYYDYGFDSLYNLLAAMADSVMLIDYGADGIAVVPISDKKTLHMESLIAEQRPNEPTRFGGVVPGLDSKETNRSRNADRRGNRGRGRSENRKTTDSFPANKKRPVSTFGSATVFEENVVDRRNEQKSTVAATFAASTPGNALQNKPTTAVTGTDSRYPRDVLMELREKSSTAANVPEIKCTHDNDDGEDLMDMVTFVTRNVLEIVKLYPDGIDLPTLTILYKETFPNDPPMELVESFGCSMEEFFADNFNGELNVSKSSNDGVFTIKPRSANVISRTPMMIPAATTPASIKNIPFSKQKSANFTSSEAALINFHDNKPHQDPPSVCDASVATDDLTTTLHNLMISDRDSAQRPYEPLSDLIYLDDDPAVLAFERRENIVSPMVSPHRPIASDSLLRSPLTSRKTTTVAPITIEGRDNVQNTPIVDYKTEFLDNDGGSSIMAYDYNQNRSSATGSSTTTTMPFDWPEKAPLLDQSKMSDKVNISQKLWQEIYSILRESSEGIEHARFTIEYFRRFQRLLSGKDLYETCGVKSLRDLFFEIHFIEVFENCSGNLAYRLCRRHGHGLNVRDKEEKHKKVCKSTIDLMMAVDSDDDNCMDDDLFDGGDELRLPPQPEELLPPKGRITDIIRHSVYHLLRKKFPYGVELTTFTIAYSKYYKRSINAETECKMTYSQVFRCMKDILDIGEDDSGQMWLKAKPVKMTSTAVARRKHTLENVLNLPALTTVAPDVMPFDVSERLDNLLSASESRGLPFANFKTLYTQPSLLAWFSLYGYQSFDQLLDRAVKENKVDVYTTPMGDKRIRLHRYKPTIAEEENFPRQQHQSVYSLSHPTQSDLFTTPGSSQYYNQRFHPPQQQIQGPPKIRPMVNTNAIRRQVESNARMNDIRSAAIRQVVDNMMAGFRERMPSMQMNANPPPLPSLPIDDAVYGGAFESVKLDLGTDYNVVVSSVQNPSHFYCQLCSLDAPFERMMDDMKSFYSDVSVSNCYKIPISLLHTGFICVAFAAQVWCRVQIVDATLKEGNKIMVLFVDFGASRLTPINDLRLLKRNYYVNSLPAIAIRCALAFVEPIDNNLDPWGVLAKKYFTKLFDDASSTLLRVVDVKRVAYYSPLVQIKVKPSNAVNYFDVADRMVNENFAIYRTNVIEHPRSTDNNLSFD